MYVVLEPTSFRLFQITDHITGFESQLKDLIKIQVPEARALNPVFGSDYWFAPQVPRQRATTSLTYEKYSWIRPINGGLKFVFDRLNYT
jgi:hypothetical protein